MIQILICVYDLYIYISLGVCCAYKIYISHFWFWKIYVLCNFVSFFILLYGMDFPMSSVFENTILIASQYLHELLNRHCLTTALQLDWWIFPRSLV